MRCDCGGEEMQLGSRVCVCVFWSARMGSRERERERKILKSVSDAREDNCMLDRSCVLVQKIVQGMGSPSVQQHKRRLLSYNQQNFAVGPIETNPRTHTKKTLLFLYTCTNEFFYSHSRILIKMGGLAARVCSRRSIRSLRSRLWIERGGLILPPPADEFNDNLRKYYNMALLSGRTHSTRQQIWQINKKKTASAAYIFDTLRECDRVLLFCGSWRPW